MSQPLSEWSDEQLARVIAEHIEPMPAEPPNWSHAESPLKVWTSSFKGFTKLTYPPNQEGYPDPQYGWRMRDMVNDLAMVLMLLEKLLVHHDVKIETGNEPNVSFNFYDGEQWNEVLAETLGKAVALAYIQAHGLERR